MSFQAKIYFWICQSLSLSISQKWVWPFWNWVWPVNFIPSTISPLFHLILGFTLIIPQTRDRWTWTPVSANNRVRPCLRTRTRTSKKSRSRTRTRTRTWTWMRTRLFIISNSTFLSKVKCLWKNYLFGWIRFFFRDWKELTWKVLS